MKNVMVIIIVIKNFISLEGLESINCKVRDNLLALCCIMYL